MIVAKVAAIGPASVAAAPIKTMSTATTNVTACTSSRNGVSTATMVNGPNVATPQPAANSTSSLTAPRASTTPGSQGAR